MLRSVQQHKLLTAGLLIGGSVLLAMVPLTAAALTNTESIAIMESQMSGNLDAFTELLKENGKAAAQACCAAGIDDFC